MEQYLSHSESSSPTAQTTIFRWVKLCECYRSKDLEPSKRGLDQIEPSTKYPGICWTARYIKTWCLKLQPCHGTLTCRFGKTLGNIRKNGEFRSEKPTKTGSMTSLSSFQSSLTNDANDVNASEMPFGAGVSGNTSV